MASPGSRTVALAEVAGVSAGTRQALDDRSTGPGSSRLDERTVAASGAEGRAPMDEAAFRALYDAMARPIWAYLYRTLGNGADADDLAQEVFLRYLKAPLDTRDPAENRAYLFRIAGNLAIDHWRRGSRREARTGDADAAAHVAAPDQAEAIALRADMAKTFRQLNPRERTLIWLSCVEGESPAEVGRALGVKSNSVPVLLFRARRKLAQLLRRAGWEG